MTTSNLALALLSVITGFIFGAGLTSWYLISQAYRRATAQQEVEKELHRDFGKLESLFQQAINDGMFGEQDQITLENDQAKVVVKKIKENHDKSSKSN